MHKNASPLALGHPEIWRSPYFQVGLVIRVVLLLVGTPWLWVHWFLPFVDSFLSQPSIDPWTQFLNSGGDRLSYPYGPILLLLNASTTLIGKALLALTGWPSLLALGFGLSIIAADLLILLVLVKLTNDASWRLLVAYWLSPLSIYICYVHGQLDIIPLSILILGICALKQRQGALAGTLFALSVAAKLTFLIACPIPLIYLWRSKRSRPLLRPFIASLLIVFTIIQAPYLLFSPGVYEITLLNPSAQSLYSLAIDMAPGVQVYVLPIVYLLLLYSLWRLERLSFELFTAGIGLAFLSIVVLAPATLGWYIWIVPFLALHQRDGTGTVHLVVGLFSAFVLLLHIIISTGTSIPLIGWNGAAPGIDAIQAGTFVVHMLTTAIAMLGIVIASQMYRRRIRNNDFFLLSRHPVTIGIAGDSGTGKDTLSTALAALFGEHSVVAVSGDDYHMWDRYAPMWNNVTHLNPQANDLARLARDVSLLRRGEAVYCHRYDHGTGRFTPAELRKANDCIIVSGLHTLYFAGHVRQIDVAIYLNMDENLRQFLKISRDTKERSHAREEILKSIQSRLPDAEKYIKPQMKNADVILSLRASNNAALTADASIDDIKFALDITLRHGIYYQELARILVGICSLHLDTLSLHDDGTIEFSVEGDVSAGDLELSAAALLPELSELLDIAPQWHDGMTGVMQLICLMQTVEVLRQRGEPGQQR